MYLRQFVSIPISECTSLVFIGSNSNLDSRKYATFNLLRFSIQNVIQAGSNVVSENKTSTWEEMAPQDKVRSASNLLVAMETTTVAMAAVIDHPVVIEAKSKSIGE